MAALAAGVVAVGLSVPVVLSLSGSGSPAPLGSSPSATPTPAGPTPPAALTATAFSGGQVDLTWSAASGRTAVNGYTLYRDGATVKFVSSVLTAYHDIGVKPEHTYAYAIDVVTVDGRSPQSEQVMVTTPRAPAVAQARVEGRFTIGGTYTEENYTNRQVGDGYDASWSFDPVCDPPLACDVRTAGDGEKEKILRRIGGRYSGSVRVPDDGLCGKVKVDEVQTITFKVTRAAFIQGVWRATRIEGTTRFEGEDAAGCVGGVGVISFTGK